MKTKRIWWVFVRGIALGVGVTMLLTALLALFAKNGAEDNTVSLLALLFKGAGLIAGVWFVCRRVRKNGALCGLITGVAYWALCLAVSLAFGGTVSLSTLFDAGFCVLTAVFSGVLFANLLK